MKKKKRKHLMPLFLAEIILLGIVFPGCSPENDLPPTPVSYVVLVYMAADNSMDTDVDYTINKIKEGAKQSAGTAVVYLDRKNAPPRLFSISQKGEETLLKSYEEENSANTTTLARVIREIKERVPSDKFGLVFWSHSMGWYPATYIPQVSTRYIGIDETPADGESSFSAMEIDQIAEALPDHVAEYIWFDVCLMGSAEALYAFRNKAAYLVGSPTEVLLAADYDASGAPYAKILPFLFGGKEDLAQACNIFYDHYNGMNYEILRSASIALVDAAELDGLYGEADKILSGKLPIVETLDTGDIQTYHSQSIPQVFFDLEEFVQHIAAPAEYADFERQLSRTVIYKAATPSFMINKDDKFTIDPARFSGLSTYIPLEECKDTNAYRYYFEKLEWSGVY